MSEQRIMTIKNVRLRHARLWKAGTIGDDDDAFFDTTVLISKKHPQIKQIKAAMKAAVEEKFNGKVPKNLHSPLRDGAEKEDQDGFDDTVYFLRAKSDVRRPVYDRDPSITLSEEDGRPLLGHWVSIKVEFFGYDNLKFKNKGVSVKLLGTQFVREDDEFSSGPVATPDDFDLIDDDFEDDINDDDSDDMFD